MIKLLKKVRKKKNNNNVNTKSFFKKSKICLVFPIF